MSAAPSVGSVIRDRIFKSVLLPAPLRPMIPTTSPLFTSNDTSLSAQNVFRALRSNGCRNRRMITSPNVGRTSPLSAMLYDLARLRIEIARLDDIRKPPLHLPKHTRPDYEHQHGRRARIQNRPPIHLPAPQHRPAKSFEQAGQRIERHHR